MNLVVQAIKGGFGLFWKGQGETLLPAFGYAKTEPFVSVDEAQRHGEYMFKQRAALVLPAAIAA